MGNRNMVTSSKLGKMLGLTKATINRLAKDVRIPSIILPSGHRRFDPEEVKAALSADVMSATFLAPIDGERK
jgi:predicted site-specific integrase-resolvase